MIDLINEKINNLLENFRQYPDKYLTESDVRCALVNELTEITELGRLQDTQDGSKSVPIHTEVRWYGQSGQLKWRSDIVILDVRTLIVKNKLFRLPSKGYGFNEPKAIIEIKLRRVNGESKSTFIKKINKDIDRLKKIKHEIPGDYFCYLIILDKREDINRDILREQNNINVYYQYAYNNLGEQNSLRNEP
ncbi:MAG: hypothetical protein KA059_02900 [Elusimicrobiales bacterium]|nr:hypothetical protein [Elusimicrobiales bacterium]